MTAAAAEVAELLRWISPDCERDQWVRILMAIKCALGENGMNIADAWSKGSDRYQAAAFRDTWRNISEAGGVTAGNASGQNDGAAACIVTTRAQAERRGLTPLLRLRSWAVAGVAPEIMGIGPVPASAAALQRAGLTLADLDLIELNEAFAAQALAVLREWGLDPADERLNPNGSAISLGHPVGATGGRILATMAYELRRRGGGLALETMCIGGGQGLAAVFEGVV